ncbi:MAG TPA: hypothetical protein VF491_15300 [Vicinamibacterales bacterium]
MRFHVTTIALVFLCGLGLAGQTRTPEAQLKAAQHKAQVEGDLKGAIELYKELVGRSGTPRSVVAEALLDLAQTYEKLGVADARKVYEQILRDYIDQRTVAAMARERISALGTVTNWYAARPLLKLPNEIAVLTLLSDGRIGGTDWETGDLVIADPASGAISHVVRGDIFSASSRPYSMFPVLSPDGRQVAYEWFGTETKEQRGELRAMSLDKGVKPRSLFADPAGVANVTPIAWSKDSTSILACLEKIAPAGSANPGGRGDFDLVWVSVGDGGVKLLKSFEWWNSGTGAPNDLGKVSLSPDGGSIAYSVPDRQGAADRSIFVMRSDGSDVRRIVTGGANEYPIWTPDGTRLLFLSDRSGDYALWSVEVGGRNQATVIKNGMERVILHGLLPSGTLVYEDSGLDPLILAEFDQPIGTNNKPSLRTIETLNGQVPAWSPDGRYLAYKRRTNNPNRPVEMVVRTSDSGELKTYAAPIPGTMRTGRPTWYADGAMQPFLRNGFRLKASGATLETITAPSTLPMGQVSPDGNTLYVSTAGGIDQFDVASGIRRGNISLPPSWRFAALSPNGQLAALVRFNDTKTPSQLAVIGIDGSGFRQLPTAVIGATSATVIWTRDSSALLVKVDVRKNVSSIQRVPLDGGAPVTIASELGELLSFDLSPDGRRIAYSLNPPTTDVWMLDVKAALK